MFLRSIRGCTRYDGLRNVDAIMQNTVISKPSFVYVTKFRQIKETIGLVELGVG